MKNKNKKKWLATAAALAAIAAMVGTFAWFTSTDKADNKFVGALAGNDIEIVEEFNPPETWEPGTKVNKDVAIKNNGDHNSLIRVSFVETIEKLTTPNSILASEASKLNKDSYIFPLRQTDLTGFKDSVLEKNDVKITVPAGNKSEGTYTFKVMEKEVTTANGTKFEYVSFWQHDTDTNKKLYAKSNGYSRDKVTNKIKTNAAPQLQYVDLTYSTPVIKDWTAAKPGIDKVTFTPPVTTSVTIKGAADPFVHIELVNFTDTATAGKWTYNKEDGWFYYIGVVAPQAQTAQLVDSVTLSDEAGNAYSKVKYTLTVNAKGIQSVVAAVDSTDWLAKTNPTIAKAYTDLPEITKE